MAAIVAPAMDVSAADCSAEEALLDAYDLQWKAIDIRLEKLRNECERMILEYEVEVKQQMYLRECEDLMRQKQAEHDAEQAALERERAVTDEQVRSAREFERRGAAAARKAQKDEVAEQEQEQRLPQEATAKVKKPAVKRKNDMVAEEADAEKQQQPQEPTTKAKKPSVKRKSEKVVEELEEEPVEDVGANKPKAVKKSQAKKKVAIEETIPRPVSPPVYSPEDDSTEEPAARKPKNVEETPLADLPHVADNELLEMLSQDHGYESEDFGDAPSLGLIHPQSPAMLSPKRLKKKAESEAAALAKTASSPLRGGAMSLADRIMSRVKANTKKPLVEPDLSSDSSDSPPPVLTPPAKRALKRRKLAVLSAAVSESAAAVQTKIAEKVAAASREMEVEYQAQKKPSADNNVTTRPRKTKRGINLDNDDSSAQHSLVQEAEPADGADHGDEETATDTAEPNMNESIDLGSDKPQIGAVTGRSKARQTAKLAALRASAQDDEDDVTGFPDIKTPKVPRKKMGVNGKKKATNDLAAKRAEFQQLLSESASAEPADTVIERPVANNKRRRQDDVPARKEPVELEFHTPKAKAKKPKIVRSAFPNDELNIMKSPVPLLRAKIAEKKKREEQEAKKNVSKRTVSERDGVDEEDPGYGGPAAAVPAISFPAKKGPEDLTTAASDYASRWINSGLVTRAKKNAVKAVRKPATKSPKPASLWGAGPSFFDAFVNTAAPAIPRLKTTSAAPKK